MVSYDLVSMAAILRDFDNPQYLGEEHELLVDIADSLYNVGINPNSFTAEYKKLYDKYGKAFWDKVLDDMSAIDSQITSDRKEKELIDDYYDRLVNSLPETLESYIPEKKSDSKSDKFEFDILSSIVSDIREVIENEDSIDTWGDIEVFSDEYGIGLDYNLCIDNSDGDMDNESAFYVMRFDPETGYYDTDYDDFVHYEIDINNPEWKSDMKKFATDYLQKIIDNNQ